jgi:hypothetical protein
MVLDRIFSCLVIFAIFTALIDSSINMADAELSYQEQVEFTSAIEETMGHISAARANIEVGNSKLVQLHLSHPITELYDNLHHGLKNNPQTDSQVELALFILKNTNPDIDGENFDQTATEILSILNEAKSILIQKEVNINPDFKLDVISDLLMMSEFEYVFGMESGGGLIGVVEFQDSYAFVSRAEIMLDGINSLEQDKKNNLLYQLGELKLLILNEDPLDVVQAQFNKVTEEINTIEGTDFDSSVVTILDVELMSNTDLESNPTQKNPKSEVDDSSIPIWIKLNAAWWADGLIPDAEFIFGLEYLIRESVLSVSENQIVSDSSTVSEIPEWIKNRTAWWADGLVPDAEFIFGLEYLIERGILHI